MDSDLDGMSRDELHAELVKLRNAVRAHRDSTGHDLCWHHPDLWNLLPERSSVSPVVPEWPAFIRGCVRYRQSLDEQLPIAPRVGQESDDDRRAWQSAEPTPPRGLTRMLCAGIPTDSSSGLRAA